MNSSAFSSQLESFLVWIQLEKGLSKNTLLSYESDLIQCSEFLEKKGFTSWSEVEGDNISEWIAELSLCEYSPSSLAEAKFHSYDCKTSAG